MLEKFNEWEEVSRWWAYFLLKYLKQENIRVSEIDVAGRQSYLFRSPVPGIKLSAILRVVMKRCLDQNEPIFKVQDDIFKGVVDDLLSMTPEEREAYITLERVV